MVIEGTEVQEEAPAAGNSNQTLNPPARGFFVYLAMKKATNIFLIKIVNGKKYVCLGMKKRGHGVGKWNGFGGKVQEKERFKNAALREFWEETGVRLKSNEIREAARVNYFEPQENWLVRVYTSHALGKEPQETEEMIPKWFPVAKVPYQNMRPNDKTWLPKILKGERFKASYWHDENGKILKYKFQEL